MENWTKIKATGWAKIMVMISDNENTYDTSDKETGNKIAKKGKTNKKVKTQMQTILKKDKKEQENKQETTDLVTTVMGTWNIRSIKDKKQLKKKTRVRKSCTKDI